MFDFLRYIEFLKFKPLSNTAGCYCSVIQDITGKELNESSREGALQHIITIITITVLHKIHQDVVLRCAMLE